MALINEHYLKLQAGYLFPEIDRRVRAFCEANPAASSRLIRCGIGDVTEPLPEAAREAMHRAIDELGRRESFRGYGPATGYPFLRETIATHDYQERGIDIDPDEVFLSDGSKGDCGAILDILAADGKNIIAIADPVYPVYVDTNVMAGNTGPAEGERYAQLRYLSATPENGFVPDLPDPGERIDIIYLCFPNNPTGGVITRAQLQRWVDYAQARDAIIMYDAAYEAYITSPELPRSVYEIDGARECAIEFRSFSKNGGFTGLRCGFTVVPKELMGRTESGERIHLHPLWWRRWSTKSNGVSYPVQRAAEALYTPDGKQEVRDLIDHYLGNAGTLREAIANLGLEVHGGVHAPYVWVRCPDGVSSWDMFDRMLAEANVVITPGAGFGRMGEGFFRISAFNSRENVEEVVTRVKLLARQPV